ncbi:helix-turn-helix domain-containing protein [Streptomyces sp. SID13726]|uniref:helix-turn-helix domain-containing protein n=1 Tax=Streptomyces sp. SID13726 TaxID=2706058 RepID=UPI0013BDE083|nr:helix-turn-helix domain-containing protein [Streptomyces sp. SID13726]
MPARHFDRELARAARRAADLRQSEVGAALGVSNSAVANWEAGHSAPDPETLPAYAAALRRGVDELFPRAGLPDLTDLRCDAGLYRAQTPAVIGTKSAGPVAGAERGERRLKDHYVPLLAARYGVSEAELRRAQERSIAAAEGEKRGGVEQGTPAAAPGRPPETLAEKINFIFERSYPGPHGPPSDAEITTEVNGHLGKEILTEKDFRDLRTGATQTAAPGVLSALAEVVGVSEMYFQSDEAVAAQVYEGLKLLAAARQGAIGRVKARGLGPQGMSPRMMALVTELAAELAQKEAEERK